MKSLNEVMSYLDCPRKYSFEKVGLKKEKSDNDKMKQRVKEAIKKYLEQDLTALQFADEVGIIGKTKVDALYNLIQENKDKLLDKDYILTVVLKTPTDGYERSLYYNIHQVINCDNKELKFNVIVLNVNPKLEQVTLKPRTEAQVKEINELVKSVDRLIDMVEKEQLVYIKRPNNITCSSCVYNAECKPICFTREVKDGENV